MSARHLEEAGSAAGRGQRVGGEDHGRRRPTAPLGRVVHVVHELPAGPVGAATPVSQVLDGRVHLVRPVRLADRIEREHKLTRLRPGYPWLVGYAPDAKAGHDE